MPPKKKSTTTTKKSAAAKDTKDKSTASSKAPPAHPPFAQMITEAITALKERNGSSRQAIKKYISKNYKVNEQLFDGAFKRYLTQGVDVGTFLVGAHEPDI